MHSLADCKEVAKVSFSQNILCYCFSGFRFIQLGCMGNGDIESRIGHKFTKAKPLEPQHPLF